jgi:hypothetical protein
VLASSPLLYNALILLLGARRNPVVLIIAVSSTRHLNPTCSPVTHSIKWQDNEQPSIYDGLAHFYNWWNI